MIPRFDFDVFLSHNTADKPRVRSLAKRLQQAGLRVWFDEWIIEFGEDIHLAIERGLETSHTLILCMSTAAFGSGWVGLERSTSIFRDPLNRNRRFVPLLLEDCTIPDTLRRYRYVDYRKEHDADFESLLAACPFGAVRPPTEKGTSGENREEAIGQSGDPRVVELNSPDLWVMIPAGEFRMGAQKEDAKKPNYDSEAYKYEAPVHTVRHRAYRIGRHEVTVAEYQRFVDAGGYIKKEYETTYWKAGGFDQWQQPDQWEAQLANPDRPVTGVSWYEASAYAAWAGCLCQTEAEWERTARGADARKYPWGGEAPDPTRANSYGNIGHPTPLGDYPLGATPEGIQDMAGNVSEWCQDVWHVNYKGAPADGSARTTDGDQDSRVLRGGSWVGFARDCRGANRDWFMRGHRVGYFGFRLAAGT